MTESNDEDIDPGVDTDSGCSLEGIPDPVYKRSIAYGERVADHILAWAKTDHFLQTRGMPKYTVTADPGRWVPTPAAYMDAIEPNWGKVRPFVMDSSSQFRPKAQFPFDTAQASPFFRQAKEVYQVGKQLSDGQRQIAAFWDCNPYVMHVQAHAMYATKKVTPGGHWMGIAAIASARFTIGGRSRKGKLRDGGLTSS